WRKAADFDENRGRPFTWLVTLARSRAIDRLRTLASRERVAEAGAREVSEEISDAATDAFKSEQRGLVSDALAKLPDEQKRPIMLAYFDGLTQSEIAARTGAPLGTVKTRMRTGMIRLRELLAGQGAGFGFLLVVHEDYKEMIPARALTALDAAEAQALNEHLENCAECRKELDGWQATAAALALGENAGEPSPKVRERILDEVRKEREAPPVVPFRSSPRNFWS